MNAPKVGDRVRVELEGTVTHAPNPWGMHRIDLDNGRLAHARFTWAAPEHCTVIAPPVKVGDVVTPDNIGQLPRESVFAYNHAVWIKNFGVWQGSTGQSYDSDAEMVDAIAATPEKPRVLRVGGGAS